MRVNRLPQISFSSSNTQQCAKLLHLPSRMTTPIKKQTGSYVISTSMLTYMDTSGQVLFF